MKFIKQWLVSGKPWVWLTGGAVSISLISVFGLLLLIGWKGLTYFWPTQLSLWQDTNGKRIVGQVYQRDSVPAEYISAHNRSLTDSAAKPARVERLNIKIANRELYSLDFISLLQDEVTHLGYPKEWAVFERTQNGDFFGKLLAYVTENGRYTSDLKTHIRHAIDFAETLRIEIERISNQDIRQIGWKLNQLRLEKQKAELNGELTAGFIEEYSEKKQALSSLLSEAESKLDLLRQRLRGDYILVEDMTGQQSPVSMEYVLDAWYPNDMSFAEKLVHWLTQVTKFILDEPREANSEGGIFPAIFGTVFLVIMMSVIVTPLGVIAAIYLHEYAASNMLTRMIRVAVINLAGVPSIVYGVFGLGFFVYHIGGSIDELFYADKLPAPTFGTPGILWSALTLALLTLPVVIVSTEEGLSRIPSSVRNGSYALGATQFETLWRIVIPMASPAILTGLILAIARAAGEVAPLMLVGVAKLAPSLPVDGNFPYVHLERKFMHLGYHIYDVGFQAPNTEAARPLVYATSFLLVMVVVGLNLTAINIRNNLREKYRSLGQD